MFSMFSPDSKFMQILSRFSDLVVLNLLFLITSLPVFTLGAALTALSDVSFRLLQESEGKITRAYFRAFRANFRQATGLFFLAVLILLPAAVYFDYCFQAQGFLHTLYPVLGCILVVGAMTFCYAFPWLSRFDNAIPQILKNALILSITHLPRTLPILAIQLTPAILWAVNYDFFLKISFLWLALYFAAAAYMTAALLLPIFKPYWEPTRN